MNFKHTIVESTKIPSARHNKVGWFENHQKHICLTKRLQPTTLLIGDSIVVGLTRYQNIWKKYFKFPKTVNCGIPGDKTQHVLWRAKNISLQIDKISLKNIIQKKKRTFFQDKLKENSNNSKELWKA